ncbi:MAG: serine/threonine-protein kinase [Thermoguttaceae bacterium]
MSAERYAQVRRLFLAACELAKSEMGAFLDQACAGDPELREELESLLKQPRSTTIIGTSSEDAAHGKVLSPISRLPGELIPADIPVGAARAENAWRFSPGEIIAAGRYKILGPLGGGGLGEVYKAHDQIMDQDVALKFLALGQSGADPTRSRFVSEVAMAREVAHPSVVRVYDIGQLADGEVFLSMEFIDGEDLASLLRRAGRLSRERTVQIARELCAGLGAAHDHGVLHRDLKPSNIVIDGDGHVHIADFGIAAFVPTAADHGYMAPEIPLAGTPAFMAPGLFHHKQPSKQSDLYALGIVLYEVATGREPFDGVPADGLQTAAKLIPPSLLCPEIEPALERAILQCLEEDPSRRPESAKAVAALLPG